MAGPHPRSVPECGLPPHSIDGVIVSRQGGALTMAEKRDGVFVWITWLARVMVGEQNCEWASWFKAHYENYDKAASDFDTAKWNIDHTRQLRRLQLERRKLASASSSKVKTPSA